MREAEAKAGDDNDQPGEPLAVAGARQCLSQSFRTRSTTFASPGSPHDGRGEVRVPITEDVERDSSSAFQRPRESPSLVLNLDA